MNHYETDKNLVFPRELKKKFILYKSKVICAFKVQICKKFRKSHDPLNNTFILYHITITYHNNNK